MTLALVAVDLDLTADVRIDFTTQITLDLVITLKVITQRNQLLIRQILDANVRIDTGRGKRFLGTSTTNTKDVGEGDLDALLIGDVDSGKTCHCDSFCFPQVLHRVVRFPGPGCVPGVHPAFTGCDSAPVLFMPLDLFSALTLLMARVDADHHDAAVTTDHAAVLADPLHTRADLHGFPLLVYLYL